MVSFTDSLGITGCGPGSALFGRAGGSSLSFTAFFTVSFQAASATLAISALPCHSSISILTVAINVRSTFLRGERTASSPGDLFMDGLPIATAHKIGGSAHPDHGETQRLFPMVAAHTDNAAAITKSGGEAFASAAVLTHDDQRAENTSSSGRTGGSGLSTRRNR